MTRSTPHTRPMEVATPCFEKPKTPRITRLLDEVLNGGASISPAMVRYVLERLRHPSVAARPSYGLSNREREILYHLVTGRTMKEVAGALGISYHTVDRQMRGLYGKLREPRRCRDEGHPGRIVGLADSRLR